MSAKIFTQVQLTKPRSNTFDLSHQKKMSLNMGELVPTMVIDCVPGDKFTIAQAQLIRFAPLVTPVMHRVKVYNHFWFVPYRLLWANWEKFITGGEDGFDNSVFPTITYGAGTIGNLADYLGLPLDNSAAPTNVINVSALPFAAYQMIYQEFYRDQNLIDDVPFKLEDGDNVAIRQELQTLRKRAWMHDYFTSALPWTQKGPEATIPLGTNAPVTFIGNSLGNTVMGPDNQPYVPSGIANIQTDASSGLIADDTGLLTALQLDNADSLEVDLSTAAAASINDLRRAFRLQEWLEKNARGGSRYIESILVHFGVRSSDKRLNRPEYLGGGSSPVSFSEVLQTSASASDVQDFDTPLANMAGHGINTGNSGASSYFCEEHGIIIGITSVMPDTGYFQGIPKHFLKFDKFDYYWPEFANIGEQPIELRELYYDSDAPEGGNSTFGYTPRYAEYKHMCNTIHGDFKDTLKNWHMARDFETVPALNQQFVESDPTDRIFAVTGGTEQKLYAQILNKVIARRMMPIFGTPTI